MRTRRIARRSGIALLADAWRSARHDSQQLATTLAAQNATIQHSGEQEKQRDTQLAAALAAIQTEKRSIRTPQQAAQELPEVLPQLPLPVSIHIPDLSPKPLPNESAEAEASITIPQPDLIPLYNNLQDCRSSQVQTATLQKDLSDEKARSAALLQERNAAITAAHGGPILQRLKRTAKWFAIGLASGAVLTIATHH
jgi:hypothetical protein